MGKGIFEIDGSVQDPEPADVAKVLTGQKYVIYAVLAALLMNLLQIVLIRALAGSGAEASAEASSSLSEWWRLPLLIALIGFQLYGLLRLATGLGYSTGERILFGILLVIPMAGLLILLYLNARATRFLRRAGYKVGLFGAHR